MASKLNPTYGAWGFDFDGQDRSVRPGDDFFSYANGTWVKKTKIPNDRSRWGTFDILRELSESRVRQICEGASAVWPDAKKINALYRSFIKEDEVEKLGEHPNHKAMVAILSSTSKAELGRIMGKSVRTFNESVFSCHIADDPKDPMRYAVTIGQAGLGLPDRDYYLDPKFAAAKAAYQAYIQNCLALSNLFGHLQRDTLAANIVDFETDIAEVSWSRAEQRDDNKMYNPMTVAELIQLAPEFPWKAFLSEAGLDSVKKVIVAEVTALPIISAIYQNTPTEIVRAWAAFHLLDNAAPYLTKRHIDLHFEFHGKVLSGQPELRPRWKRAVNFTDAMGESVGRLYVNRYFTPEAKRQIDELVTNVIAAMGNRISNLKWMSPQTKKLALEKLSKFTIKIGYPAKWRDYGRYEVRESDLFGNAERSIEFEWVYQLRRLNLPVDREEWEMTPQTVNAYFGPTKNEIVFPAAILQPPFFDPSADSAVNYGAIGGVIGHEICHAFDDSGSRYNGDGMLTNWWMPADENAFGQLTTKLAEQYSALEPLPGHFVNGQLTLGENGADGAGLAVALDAYRASLKGEPAAVLDGFTGDQRVFLGWAQAWRGKSRDDALKQQLVTDPHSPPTCRVNATFQNLDAWYDAFGVRPGDKLFVPPERRVRIW